MNIGVDARVLEKGVTGIGRILDGVIHGLPSLDPSIHFTLFSNSPINIEGKNIRCIATNTNSRFPKIIAPLWLNNILPRYIREHDIDLFFAPNFFLSSSLKGMKIKSVVVIHDLIHKVHPEFQPFIYRTYLDRAVKRSAKNADSIVTDSECSKQDIVRHYDVSPDDVHVVYPFIQNKFTTTAVMDETIAEVRAKYSLPASYLLFVGVIEKRKNIETIIAVHSRLKNRGIDIPVILVGRKGYGSDDILTAVSEHPGIRYIKYVHDSDLPLIYKLSTVFVFPSLYEGFGFPPLEAMQSGIPAVTSNAGSLSEVINSAAPQFDARNVEGITGAVEKLLTDQLYYNEVKMSCVRQASNFNQNVSLKALYSVFRNTLDQ
jgi:glycosyltransferase involved in cell wall biosynthesis